MKKIILIGAGGHANSIVEIIENSKSYKILGFIDKFKKGTFNKYKIIGNDLSIKQKIIKNNIFFFISVGLIKNFKVRSQIIETLKKKKFKLATIISKYAIVSKSSLIGNGTLILNNALINRNCRIGENSIINSSAILEHDVSIGHNTHISTGAIINGDVKIGSNTFIGSGSIIREGTKIGDNCIIGMGSIIKKDITSNKIIK